MAQAQRQSTAVATHAQPAPANGEADRNRRALEDALDRAVEYKPFLSEETISLSPRMVLKFLCRPTKKGAVASYDQAVRFVMLCKARGLNPWEGDAFLVGYDGQDGPEFSLITAHQAFLKRAEVHPEYDGLESGVVVRGKDGGPAAELPGDLVEDGQQILGGWARVFFKNRSHPMYKRLKLATFNKGFSRWRVDPAGMIVKCAEADALRSAFPNSLGGMYLAEEAGPREAAIAAAPEALPAGRLDLRAAAKAAPDPEPAPDPGPTDEQYQRDPLPADELDEINRGDAAE
jgi:phage recombination protein Bet